MTTDKQRIAEQTAKEFAQLRKIRILSTATIPSIDEDTELLSGLILRALEHSEQGWVSVSERLPNDNVPCLVIGRNWQNGADIAWFWPTSMRFVGYDIEAVTHWMPLPVPPVHPESAQEVTDAG